MMTMMMMMLVMIEVYDCETDTSLTVLTAGSPFTVKVNGPPDPSKVRVSGEGIRNGILQQYNGSFSVNTQGAGPGELTVKIRGPKGLHSSAFSVVFLCHVEDKYCVTEAQQNKHNSML